MVRKRFAPNPGAWLKAGAVGSASLDALAAGSALAAALDARDDESAGGSASEALLVAEDGLEVLPVAVDDACLVGGHLLSGQPAGGVKRRGRVVNIGLQPLELGGELEHQRVQRLLLDAGLQPAGSLTQADHSSMSTGYQALVVR